MQTPRRVAIMLDLDQSYKRHTEIYAGTQKYASEQGWEVTIDEFADDTLPVRRTKSVPYHGVIARSTKKLAQRAAKNKIPVVNVWANSPARNLLPCIFPNFTEIGTLRAEHLLTRGFSHFAGLTGRDVANEAEMSAFCQTLADAGHSCKVAYVSNNQANSLTNWRMTEQVITDWMNDWKPPIGIFIGAESTARMVVQMCRSRGLRIPEDVAIIAGWNEETLCEHPSPSLTSVELNHERIGYEAARLLHQLMDGQAPPTEPMFLSPQGLVVRESTDFFAVEDELVAQSLEFISANSHLRIGPKDVAKAVSVGIETLKLRFRKHLKRPIAKEIRRVRTERAKRELAQTKQPLSKIARNVGFGETMRMYEVFRRDLGMTPSEYRKKNQLPDAS